MIDLMPVGDACMWPRVLLDLLIIFELNWNIVCRNHAEYCICTACACACKR